MAYWREIRVNGHALFAACIGMALGSALSHYTMSLFGPELIEEFGWSKAEFALIGTLQLINLALIPLAGYFVDRLGVLPAAMTGFIALPASYCALAMMSGSITTFFAIVIVMQAFGSLSSSLVFCRMAVERFDLARGIALAAVMAASPIGGAIAAPLIGEIIATSGWRAAYFSLAAISASGGVISVGMIGLLRHRDNRPASNTARMGPAGIRHQVQGILGLLKSPVLILIFAGMFMVNIPQVFASSQMKLIAMSAGASGGFANWLVSLYATGVVAGRMATGLALDRIEPHRVAIVALGLPAVGYAILAGGSVAEPMLMMSILLIGLAQGAEGDLGGFMLSRRFDLAHFSLLFGLLTAMLSGGSAAGSLVLSVTLATTGGYEAFLIFSAIGTLIGAACFAGTGFGRFSITGRDADRAQAPSEG